MAKELEKKNKTIWSSMWAIMIVSMTALIAGVFIAAPIGKMIKAIQM